MLKEVKYLKLFKKPNIPPFAEKVFSMRDMIFKNYANLMVIVHMYNRLITESMPVEQPLIKGALERINKQLEAAINELQWKKQGNLFYIVKQNFLYICPHVYIYIKKLYGFWRSIKAIEVATTLKVWTFTPVVHDSTK